jgi:tetratricopeptide (TPR) repeat protein
MRLRHEYAHFLFRNGQGLDRPLWYDEGFAQLASTIQVHDSSVTVGRVRKDHIELLQNRLWLPGPELVALSSLGDFDSVNRDIFRAQSWALVHSLLLGRRDPGGARARAQAYLDRVAAGGSHDDALKRAFGADSKGLARRLAREVRAGDFLLSEMRAQVPEQGVPPALRPLAVGEVTTILGWLAISLGRPTLASSYFEKAVAENPQDPSATAGLGAVAKLRGEWDVAAPYYAAALVGAPDDAIVQLEAGSYYHTRAARAEDAVERGGLVALAREHYGRSIALDGSLAEPHAVLGATYLLPGQKPRGGLASLDQSAALLPASLEIELLRANLSARMAVPETARRRALNVYSRTHSHDLADAALRLIEAIDL